jgi:hypothetical protein
MPVYRALQPAHRRHAIVLAVVAAWLTGFGWLDDRLSEGLDPAGAWQWDESLVDFVRWMGWIPLVIGLSRWLAKDARASAAPR